MKGCRSQNYAVGLLLAVLSSSALAGSLYQPPGANLTLGDVTHGMRVQSASSNPAAAAVDVYRADSKSTRGTVLSIAGGLEYGNVQELFDFYDELTKAHKPSDPDTTPPPPGQDPGDKPDDGINIGDILDMLDPDLREAVDAIAREVAIQAAILAFVSVEG